MLIRPNAPSVRSAPSSTPLKFTTFNVQPLSPSEYKGSFHITGVCDGEFFAGVKKGGSYAGPGQAPVGQELMELYFRIPIRTLEQNQLVDTLKPEFLRLVRGNESTDIPLLATGSKATEFLYAGAYPSVSQGAISLGAVLSKAELDAAKKAGDISVAAAVRVNGERKWINLEGRPGENFKL